MRREPTSLTVVGVKTFSRIASTSIAVAATAFAAAAPAGAATAPASAPSSPQAAPTSAAAACGAVADGRVQGLEGTPERVTLALASDYGTSYATLTECVRSGDGYAVDFSVDARIGSEGFAPEGAKREGDGRSPSGVYSFGTGFGAADPGSSTGYREITDRSCWVDEPGSTYNTWQETNDCRGEHLADYVDQDYAQGIVINHNTADPVAGMGSAIFLHASGDGATAGCISIPEARVSEKMRATHEGDRIVMGVAEDMIGEASGSDSGSGAITHTLYPGSPHHAEVRTLQRELGVGVDGIYGPVTEGAVEDVQRSEGLVVDGIAGPKTLGALGLA